MSTEPNKGDIVERCKRTASAMSRTSPDSGIDICHITTVNEAAAEIRALREPKESARKKLSELSALDDNWDGLGASHICMPPLHIADEMTQSVPQIVPDCNGGIQLEWYGATRSVEVHIDKEGRITGYAKVLEIESPSSADELESLRSQVADLTAQRDAMREAIRLLSVDLVCITSAVAGYGDMTKHPQSIQNVICQEAIASAMGKREAAALALCQPSPGAQPSKGSP